MSTLNPYEPNNRDSDALSDCTIAKKHLVSFLMIQFVSFVVTFMVTGIAISCYQAGVGTVIQSPLKAFSFAGLAIVLWLPHAIAALTSNKFRCAGAKLGGVFAATVLLFGTHAMDWIFGNLLLSFSLSGYLFVALGLLISLAAVGSLGHFRAIHTNQS